MRLALVNAPRVGGLPVVRMTEGSWISRYDVLPAWECGYLAAAIKRRDPTAYVVHIDANAEDLSDDALVDRLEGAHPDRVVVKVGLATLGGDVAAAVRYKRRHPDCQLLLSSNLLMTVEHEALAAHPEVDGVARGELDAYAADLLGSAPLSAIPGIVTRDGSPQEEPVRVVKDLDADPIPDWEVYPPLWGRGYHGPAALSTSGLVLISTRGCAHRCSYCTTGGNVFGGYNRVRKRDPRNVVDELQWLVRRFGARDFVLCAEPIFTYRDHATAVAEEILRRDLKLAFSCCGRPEQADPELVALLGRAGCRFICYGMESDDPAVLESYGRQQPPGAVARAVALTKRNGMVAGVYLLAGGDQERWGTLCRSLATVLRIDPDVVLFNTIVPFPGTRMYERARARGLLTSTDFRHYEPVRFGFWGRRMTLRSERLSGWQLALGDRLMRLILYRVLDKNVYRYYFRHFAP